VNFRLQPSEFFDILLKEIREYPTLQGYYRFLQNANTFEFRKAYYMQRLEYIARRVQNSPGTRIWDIGCGYGTTAIFLVLNGYKVRGSTLEYYFKEIPDRLSFWSQYGDLSELQLDYENLFDYQARPEVSYDFILVQDTLHHLEPIDRALQIIADSLKPGGEMIAVEENGSNIIQRLKLYKQRGNKRIITIHDQRLGKDILLGNENIRSVEKWTELCSAAGLKVLPESLHYVRLFPPYKFKNSDSSEVINREQKLWRKNSVLRRYFFFGLNFSAVKPR
jgi:SAM-dependent methyltransferase